MSTDTAATQPRFVPGLGAFADRYEGFIVDQWGVLHDGAAPYPGALDALAELQRRNKRVVLLSNSGRRAAHARRLLASLGFHLPSFAEVVTSGEAAWKLLAAAPAPFDRGRRRCHLVTRDGDQEVITGNGVSLADGPDDADFLFIAGVDSPRLGVEDYRPALEACARRGLPALCSNPDLLAPSAGAIVLGPGSLARAYEAMGGSVTYVGKPHGPIYTPCLEALERLEPGEIVAVGDSLEHDIVGANGAGVAAAFVSGGLHGAEFGAADDEAMLRAALDRLAAHHGGRPDWVIPRFAW